jgi:P4 family phage/plasmid primase-like protien
LIQILGLRDYTDQKTGLVKKRETFFSNNWRAESVEEIFTHIDEKLLVIPEKERFNLYFTVADCFEERGRKLKEQHIICFDIDNLLGDTDENILYQAELVAKAACVALGVEYNQTGIIFSGHGVQLFIRIPYPILSEDYFESARPHYKLLCDRIQGRLNEQGISGNVDPSVFSKGRLMRLPNTENRKPGKPVRTALILQRNIEIQHFYIEQLSGISEIEKPDAVPHQVLKTYPEPDADAVLKGCEFLKFCFSHPGDVKEPQWYAAASIVPLLYKDADKGKALFHQMSEGHPQYNYYETDLKAAQAVANSGPRTCKNIDSLWDGCKTCPHYGGKLVSPILIHGPDYIKSKDFGFREMRKDKSGNLVAGKPAYDDLIKQFTKENVFITIIEENAVYAFNGTHWVEKTNVELKSWVKKQVSPSPSSAEAKEFVDRLRMDNIKHQDWFPETTEGKMNFKNGVLDVNTLELTPHDPQHGFTHVLPYAYDSRAECPTWDKFIHDITGNDEVSRVLNEFAGYSIAGGDCRAQKALMLLGEGANGKSVYAETLAKVVGEDNFSSILLSDLKKDQVRASLNNKLFNYSDESSIYALKDSSEFKTLITGGHTTAKVVYKPVIQFKNRAKFIVLTNELPTAYDISDGFFRRLIIVRLHKQFKGDLDNKDLRKQLWAELPGIARRFVEGFKLLRERGYHFDEPDTITQNVELYRESSNDAARFILDEVEITSNESDEVPMQEFYAKYESWCKATGEKPKTLILFFKDLRRVTSMSRCNIGAVKRIDGKVHRMITNVKYRGDF